MTDPATHVFWITSRSAGITALVCASASVAAGLALGGSVGALAGLVRGRTAHLRTLHEALSLAALAALLVHGLALLGDAYLRPGLLDITVPFISHYRPFWTGLGIVGAYGLAALSLTYYARARIGVARWRTLHRFIAFFWLLGVVHTLGAGTDAGRGWFLLLLAVVVLPPLSLLAIRVTAPVRSGRAAQGQAAGTLARREARRA
ncbi:MAG: hypothetical protein QOG42_1392 [Solirubrobacteraceae bacterium]|jgi:sulfoxide reductase heme-binding subunit YedZ|nr:hypothetical protein [Solirubrobacteraceae bacterium]